MALPRKRRQYLDEASRLERLRELIDQARSAEQREHIAALRNPQAAEKIVGPSEIGSDEPGADDTKASAASWCRG
jgi:hypothetical protein